MAPHGSTKDEGSQAPAPTTLPGQYNVQVRASSSVLRIRVTATHHAHRPSQ